LLRIISIYWVEIFAPGGGTMLKKDFFREIAKILEVPEAEVSGNIALSDFEQWNSLAVLAFIAMADEKLHTVVSPKDLGKAQTIDDLCSLVAGSVDG
jgi:acyl carrier protein